MLSVIIPAFNEEKYIAETLKRLTDYETIVVCNGCTDDTKNVAEKYATKVVELEEKGVSKARNQGVKNATHDRVVFLDADILVDDEVLEQISRSNFNIGTSNVRANSRRVDYRTIMWVKSRIHRLGTCTGLIFCDKVLFNKVEGFEEDLSIKEDGRFLRRAIKLGRFGVVNGYVYNNMRRFDDVGYVKIALYWIKAYLFANNREYSSVR